MLFSKAQVRIAVAILVCIIVLRLVLLSYGNIAIIWQYQYLDDYAD